MTTLGGLWYMPWGFNFPQNDSTSYCITTEVTFNSTYSGTLNISNFLAGRPGKSPLVIDFQVAVSNSAIWIGKIPFYWIAADIVDYQWGLCIFNLGNQTIVMMLSRTATIDSSIVSNAITTLENQGYSTSISSVLCITMLNLR